MPRPISIDTLAGGALVEDVTPIDRKTAAALVDYIKANVDGLTTYATAVDMANKSLVSKWEKEVVSQTTRFLQLNLPTLQTKTLRLMLRDIEEAAGHGDLGHTCDVNDWLWLREDILEELARRGGD